MRRGWLLLVSLGCHNAASAAGSAAQEPPTCVSDPLRDPDAKCPGGYIVEDSRGEPDAGLRRICKAVVIVDGDTRPCARR